MSTLQTAIIDFQRHCKFEKSLSPKTIKAYSIDLAQFSTFMTQRDHVTQITSITKMELREFLESISALKPKSVKRKIATLKAMFNYLEFEDRLIVNPFRKMRIQIRETKTLPSVMDIGEVSRIFNTAYKLKNEIKNPRCYSYFESIRNIATIELLFATGARVSEIANLREESINLYTGSITIKGKGNKERAIQVCNPEAISLLKAYYHLFKSRKEKADGYFLVNRLNKKLSAQSIRNMVKKLSGKAGINRRITPHVFRHSFATLLLERDVDIKYIQSLLGHSSIMTTQIYTHVNRAKQRKILLAKHPRRDFSMSKEVINAG